MAVKVISIEILNDQTIVHCTVFTDLSPYFTSPMDSKDLGIVTAICNNDNAITVKIAQLHYKYVALPLQDGYFLLIPLPHVFQ